MIEDIESEEGDAEAEPRSDWVDLRDRLAVRNKLEELETYLRAALDTSKYAFPRGSRIEMRDPNLGGRENSFLINRDKIWRKTGNISVRHCILQVRLQAPELP